MLNYVFSFCLFYIIQPANMDRPIMFIRTINLPYFYWTTVCLAFSYIQGGSNMTD